MSLAASLASALHSAVLSTWGEPCVYAGRAIRAEFREAASVVAQEGDTFLQTTMPAIAVRLADLAAAPAHDDAVTVSGRNWRVTEIEPDTGGMSRIYLRRVQ
jgi:hypothetical protein